MNAAARYFALIKPDKLGRLLAAAGIAVLIALPLDHYAWVRVGLTLVGGLFAAAAGNVLNMLIERNIDATCPRTASRPLAAGMLRPIEALAYAGGLIVAASIISLSAGMEIAALTFSVVLAYAVVYTCWLKRMTPYYTVAAGAIWAAPIPIVWIAAGKPPSAVPLLAFALVAGWTALHAWSVGLLDPDAYRARGTPFMPLVWGPQATRLNMLAIACALAAAGALINPQLLLPAGAGLVAISIASCAARSSRVDGVISRGAIVYVGAFVCAVVLNQVVRL